jgi:hypothetical protein
MIPSYKLFGRKLVIVGAYGSGKTEFSLNLAKQMAAKGPLVLVDLDIVNPYFRSRDATEILEPLGVEVVYNREFRDADLPALSARTDTVLAGSETVIIDVGGDDGARVLGRYKASLKQHKAEIWMVVNCFRPFTADPEGIRATASRIESQSGLKITALVNNSNLGRETTPDHVRQGAAIIKEAAGQMGVGVPYHCCRPQHIQKLPEFQDKLFSMELSLFPADIT